ncbi:glycerol dehydrogenase [Cupriavidus pinatubonensis]|uniref:Glycerol dehydrogenase n=1 Tax=Cupriavidus pinatubonensis TaxID=248026 RepID=A0ABM8WTH9_9BURK|nr:glycerol dehydrogenase [Cupriavidus pinatubonensis]CAG9170784.1 Glycerol dehydrogenase [Cupriavidus pinatubonensis]
MGRQTPHAYATFGAPKRYVQGPDAIDLLGSEVAQLGRSAIVLADPSIYDLLEERIERTLASANVHAHTLLFNGEVTAAEIQRLTDASSAIPSDIIVAVGGGKCLDAGKAISAALGVPVATVPTIASNDSPTSHIYVLYDDDHRLVEVGRLKRGNPELVLVDTSIIARAPIRQLIAGIGDAISKRFEVRQSMTNGGQNVFGSRPCATAEVLSEACYALVRKHAVAAIAEVRQGCPSENLEKLVEATVLLSGLSFENGGLSIAHAMTRGFTAVPCLAQSAHGLQVAYGLLVQLTLQDVDPDDIEDLREFYSQVGLPLSLTELGADHVGHDTLASIAEGTMTAPHTQNFGRSLEAADISAAMEQVETEAVRRRQTH